MMMLMMIDIDIDTSDELTVFPSSTLPLPTSLPSRLIQVFKPVRIEPCTEPCAETIFIGRAGSSPAFLLPPLPFLSRFPSLISPFPPLSIVVP